MIDAELEEEIREMLVDLPIVFISSLANQGMDLLKDKLWELIHE